MIFENKCSEMASDQVFILLGEVFISHRDEYLELTEDTVTVKNTHKEDALKLCVSIDYRIINYSLFFPVWCYWIHL